MFALTILSKIQSVEFKTVTTVNLEGFDVPDEYPYTYGDVEKIIDIRKKAEEENYHSICKMITLAYMTENYNSLKNSMSLPQVDPINKFNSMVENYLNTCLKSVTIEILDDIYSAVAAGEGMQKFFKLVNPIKG